MTNRAATVVTEIRMVRAVPTEESNRHYWIKWLYVYVCCVICPSLEAVTLIVHTLYSRADLLSPSTGSRMNSRHQLYWSLLVQRRPLTFGVHGNSNWRLEPFVVHQTFDGHVFQQAWLHHQCADDQSGPVALGKVCCHGGTHGAIIPLHVPHYLSRGPRHRGAVGFNHTWSGSFVAHLRFGQHWQEGKEAESWWEHVFCCK